MQQKITRDQAALMFSNSGYYLNMFLKYFHLSPDDDDLFDRKMIEKFKADDRMKHLEMDFFDARMKLKRSAETYSTAFLERAEATNRLIRHMNFNISEIAAAASINKLPTFKRKGSLTYFIGDIYEIACKLIMAAPPVEAAPITAKKGRK